jgi:hypothetical protein
MTDTIVEDPLALNPNPEPPAPEPPADPKPSPEPTPKAPDAVTPPIDKGGGAPGVEGVDEKTLADLRAGRIFPKHRFDEVSTRNKAYADLGTPEEIKAKLEAQKTPETPPESPDTEGLSAEEKAQREKDDKEMMAWVLKKFPELADIREGGKLAEVIASLKATADRNQASEDRAMESHLNAMRGELKTWAGTQGIAPENEAALTMLESTIQGVIEAKAAAGDTSWSDRLYGQKDPTVLKEIFEHVQKTLFSGVQRRGTADILRDKNKQEQLTKPPAPGAPPPGEVPKDPKNMTMDEVGDNAWERMHGGRKVGQ